MVIGLVEDRPVFINYAYLLFLYIDSGKEYYRHICIWKMRWLICTLLIHSAVAWSIFGFNTANENKLTDIPDYVTKYAPVVHLYSEERYLPYGIEEYVNHFTLTNSYHENITEVLAEGETLTLDKLGAASKLDDQESFYLTAVDNFADDPDWITGKRHFPDLETGKMAHAPSVLIVVDKGDGIVDAFWFYFYSFNLGPFVMGGGPYGNHIGDWEHSLVRFQDGVPQIVWMSAHGGGSAYKFGAVDKLRRDKDRPVIFSARGTHANYVSVGQHSHDLPFYMLSDFTDRGPLWDPRENYLAYIYNGENVLMADGSIPGREESYGDWLAFLGHWGDQKLGPLDPRQRFHPFEWRFIDGPTGPLTKNLMRVKVCQRSKWWNIFERCRVRHKILMGEGIEAEGGGCALLFDSVKPIFLQYLIRTITWGGWGCFIADSLWG